MKRIRHRVHYFPAGFSTVASSFLAKRKIMENIKVPSSLFFSFMWVIAISYEAVDSKYRFLSSVSFALKSHGI